MLDQQLQNLRSEAARYECSDSRKKQKQEEKTNGSLLKHHSLLKQPVSAYESEIRKRMNAQQLCYSIKIR